MSDKVRIFAYKPFKDSLSPDVYEALKNKFREYKEKGVQPHDFGRDTTFDFPENANPFGPRTEGQCNLTGSESLLSSQTAKFLQGFKLELCSNAVLH